jgi:GT2 family glycosyltransferase
MELKVDTIGVLIAAWKRPTYLINCLIGFSHQTKCLDDIIVIVNEIDTLTRIALDEYAVDHPEVRVFVVNKIGTVHARETGIAACRTDVLIMVDDDTVPYPDFVERVFETFKQDPTIGGVGGRDRCFINGAFNDNKVNVVGKISWFGRCEGNFHLGYGEARDVELLKGANMSFRSVVFKDVLFDQRLRGYGAQPCEDKRFSVCVRKAGWKLVYDPKILVDHFVAQRVETRHYDGIQILKNATDIKGLIDFAFNEMISIWDVLPYHRRIVFALWSILIGCDVCPGLAQAIRFTPRLGIMSWKRFFYAQVGIISALKELLLDSPSLKKF